MSAVVLRRAATLIRERAEAATPGPWEAGRLIRAGGATVAASTINCNRPDENATHIASWHPVVAIAVADWLDNEAAIWDRSFADTQRPSAGIEQPPAVHYNDPESAAMTADWHTRDALAVACAYLGEDPS